VGEQRLSGSFDFVWSLPVPRSAQICAMFALYTLLSMPGMVLALVVAAWRFSVPLEVSWLLVPAVLLAALMAVAVGAGMAFAITHPMVTNLISNALIFVVLLFTPIVYPASNLPDWLQTTHEVLPFAHMATVIRAGLTEGVVTDVGTSFLVLGAWALAGTAVVAHRRGGGPRRQDRRRRVTPQPTPAARSSARPATIPGQAPGEPVRVACGASSSAGSSGAGGLSDVGEVPSTPTNRRGARPMRFACHVSKPCGLRVAPGNS